MVACPASQNMEHEPDSSFLAGLSVSAANSAKSVLGVEARLHEQFGYVNFIEDGHASFTWGGEEGCFWDDENRCLLAG